MNRISKIKQKTATIVGDDKWYNFILFEQINNMFPEHRIYLGEDNNVYMIMFQDQLFSLSLFSKIKPEEGIDFNYIYYFDEKRGLLIKNDSIWTKYKLAYFTL